MPGTKIFKILVYTTYSAFGATQPMGQKTSNFVQVICFSILTIVQIFRQR